MVREMIRTADKYTLRKAYILTRTGREKVVWHVMLGDFVADAFDLRRDAKFYMDAWNAYAELRLREACPQSVYHEAELPTSE